MSKLRSLNPLLCTAFSIRCNVYEVLPLLLESGPLLRFAASPTFTTVPLAHLARPMMIRRSVHVIFTRLLCCESERSLHFSLAAVSHFGRLCVRNTSLYETTSVRRRWWKPQKQATNLGWYSLVIWLCHTRSTPCVIENFRHYARKRKIMKARNRISVYVGRLYYFLPSPADRLDRSHASFVLQTLAHS